MKACFKKFLVLAVLPLLFLAAPGVYASPLSAEGDYPREDSPSDMDQSGYTAADNSDLVNDWESQDINPLSAANEKTENEEAGPAPEVKRAKSKPQLIRIENMRREEALEAEKKKENPPAEEKDEESLLEDEESLLS